MNLENSSRQTFLGPVSYLLLFFFFFLWKTWIATETSSYNEKKEKNREKQKQHSLKHFDTEKADCHSIQKLVIQMLYVFLLTNL